MEYDDLELDTLGEQKTALFVIISDTDAPLISWCQSCIHSSLIYFVTRQMMSITAGSRFM